MARRKITVDDMDRWEIDERGQLFWEDRAVVFERRIGLEGPTFWVAVIATAATVVSAVWPIGVHFGWWGADIQPCQICQLVVSPSQAAPDG
jgi:hypothetical protein